MKRWKKKEHFLLSIRHFYLIDSTQLHTLDMRHWPFLFRFTYNAPCHPFPPTSALLEITSNYSGR